MDQTKQDPNWDLIPQHATGILPFHEMRSHETKDKSSTTGSTVSTSHVVTIGILDTGIDPAIFHNDPKTKLIDCIDCTSSGDVDVSHEVELEKVMDDEKNPTGSYHFQVTGITGRTLKLSKDLSIKPFPTVPATTSNSGDSEAIAIDSTSDAVSPKLMVRLGISIGYQLFPKSLVTTCRKNHHLRKKDVNRHIASLHEKIAAWKQTYVIQKDNQPTSTLIRQRDDWQAQLDVLQKFMSTSDSANDPGPVYDCIVFWDGSHYRTVIDINESGDLRSLKPLTSFGIEHEYGTFQIPSTDENIHNVNFAVQFYKHGKVLSIVTDCSPHGTHVAQIAATTATSGVPSTAHTPTVHLISFKIGDPRLGTMETGAALIRALQLASASKVYHCDVINISYGEAVVHATSGQRFTKCVNDCVYRYNTMIVCAAGNHGPALTTNNAPGGVLSACLSIAAVVTPSMQETLYSILPTTNRDEEGGVDGTISTNSDTTFTWSSVGPTADGDWGVNLCAPGGAIASVPQWCMSKSQLMNGTSMASPHATGCVALLMGACKAENIVFSPIRIRRALENTAEVLANRNSLEQGCGMIQVHKAWEYIQIHRDDMSEDVGFNVEIVNPYNGNYSTPRGIYLRQMEETMNNHAFTVRVGPKFSHVGDANIICQRKLDFQQSVTLNATCDWVTTATKFILTSDGRTFDVEVDPTKLEHGLHTATVTGMFQYNNVQKALFSVPIVVAKPILPVQQIVKIGALDFQPAEIKRLYVVPPFGSTWMDISITDTRDNGDTDKTSRAIALHTVQLLDHAAYRNNECNKRLGLSPGQTHISSIPVEANVTCEIVLARYWLTRRTTSMDVQIHFRGIRPVPNELTMIAGSGGTMIRTYSDLASETIHPTCKLTKWQVPLRPIGDLTIAPLHDERDGPLSNDYKNGYEMILTYTFENEEKGSFIPRAPALQGVLYEAAFESQCMFVFDSEKKYLGMSDAYPSSISAAKGTVVIRLQIRHNDPSQLEKLKDMVIWIERNLSKDISLSAYDTRENMLLNTNSFSKHIMKKGTSMPVFFSEPEQSQLPANYAAGHRFLGAVTFAANDESLPGAGKRPNGFPIWYVFNGIGMYESTIELPSTQFSPQKLFLFFHSFTAGPIHAKKVSVEAKSVPPTIKPTLENKMDDAVRDLKIECLSKITGEQNDTTFSNLWDKLVLDYPDNLKLQMAKLKFLDENPKREKNLAAIIEAANDIIGRISEDDLAKCLGRKVDLENGDSIEVRIHPHCC